MVKLPTLGKQKPYFATSSRITKVNIEHSGKVTKKFFRNVFTVTYCLDGHSRFDDWNFVIFEQCETLEHLKEREPFWQHRLKTFYPVGLNEKQEYLY